MKKAAVVLLVGLVCCWTAVGLEAGGLSGELITHAKTYDDASVEYQGELIGSVLDRGSFAWLNIHDGANAIGVWAQKSQLPDIRFGGMYGVRGDRLRVVGVFHRSCLEHGGALDIHAVTVEMLEPGQEIRELASLDRVKALAVLSGVVTCLWILRLWRKRRNRR
jgi:hypothetical protein